MSIDRRNLDSGTRAAADAALRTRESVRAAAETSPRQEAAQQVNEVRESVVEAQLRDLDRTIGTFESPPPAVHAERVRHYDSVFQGYRFALLAAFRQRLEQQGLAEIPAETIQQLKDEQVAILRQLASQDGDNSKISYDDLRQDRRFSFTPRLLSIVDRERALVRIEKDAEGEERRAYFRNGQADIEKYRQVRALVGQEIRERAADIVAAGIPTGSALTFAAETERVLIRTVGAGYLRMNRGRFQYLDAQNQAQEIELDGFRELWQELQTDENVRRIMANDNSDTASQATEALDELIDQDDAEEELFARLRSASKDESRSRNYKRLSNEVSLGSMGIAGLEVLLGSTVVLNLLLNNKNFYKSPLFWASAAGLAAVVHSNHPQFFEKLTPQASAVQEQLREELESPENPLPPAVGMWLSQAVRKEDLAPTTALARVLTQRKQGPAEGQVMTSSELGRILFRNRNRQIPAALQRHIVTAESGADRLFGLLVDCMNNHLDPQSIINPETLEDLA